MAQALQDSPTVIIIGAGVIGLSCALRLQALLAKPPAPKPPIEILLVAKEWPTSIPGSPIKHSPDYASMWAGAHVRPIPASSPQLVREAAWLKATATEMERQMAEEPWCGITSVLGVEYLEAPPAAYSAQTSRSFAEESGLRGYRQLAPSEVPEGVALAYEYRTYCVNAPLYCSNLLRRFLMQGGRTMGMALQSEWEAYTLRPNVKLVINASGVGFGDPKCFPTRGQTVVTDLVGATRTVTKQNKDGTWSFIIPRFFNGGTIIGGTKEPRDWASQPDLATREQLIRRGRDLLSSSSESHILSDHNIGVIADVVGRRPTRDGGMRIEIEKGEVTLAEKHQPAAASVVHAYGAGGRGYEISWGVADEVVRLAAQLLVKDLAIHSRL